MKLAFGHIEKGGEIKSTLYFDLEYYDPYQRKRFILETNPYSSWKLQLSDTKIQTKAKNQ